MADNRAVYQKIRILPRLMRDVSNIDLTCRLMGEPPALSMSCNYAAPTRPLDRSLLKAEHMP